MKGFVSDTARRLNAAAAELAPRLLPGGKRAGNYWQAGDVTGGSGQSLFVHLAGDRRGRWQDMATGEGGDMLDLIRIQQGVTPAAAARIGTDLLGSPSIGGTGINQPASVTGGALAHKSSYDSIKVAKALWGRSGAIKDTQGAAYLAARGIDAGILASCSDMRFLAEARTKEDDRVLVLPAIITAVRDQSGQLTGVHRTFLAPDGSGKAQITTPKRALGRLHGSAALLAPVGRCLVVAEGIETSLSLKAAFPGIALMAALTAPHMAVLNIADRFTRILIAADPDIAGLRAATALANRLHDQGRPARIICPDPNQGDFNDVLMAGGVSAVKALVRSQLKAT